MDKKIQTFVFTEENAHISDPFLLMVLNITDKAAKKLAEKESKKESA